jgi:hypothetical protein
MAFEFSPSTSVSAQSLNTPQGGQLGGQSGNLLSTLSNLTTIETQQQALDKARATNRKKKGWRSIRWRATGFKS